jgi:cell division cycle 20, cofactor of APC complex
MSGGDRHIPNRSGMESSTSSSANSSLLEDRPESVNDETKNARVLSFQKKAPLGNKDSFYQSGSTKVAKKIESVKSTRHIPSAPVRILDAPDMLDDYYLNLLSWSSTNVLAVALTSAVYLWDASTGNIDELMSVDEQDETDYITSVAWMQQATHLAVGTNSCTVQLWDVAQGKSVRTLNGHSARVGALAWNGPLLTSGSKDSTILNHDMRIRNHIVGKLTNHTQEVCGLAWSPDGSYLASGANDNTLCIYDSANTLSLNGGAKHVITDHQAAVRALAWSPHERNLLASGGGTADRCIKFWNAASGALINSIDTGSQVCALQWSPLEKEILSSHGYADNHLSLWKYPTMAKVKDFKGHTSRPLHMATSPDGSLVCSGSGDESLRFWNIFASESRRKSDAPVVAGALGGSAGSLRIR